MPSIYQLKPAFQNLLRPMVQWLAAVGITANQVTTIATLLSIGCGGLITWHHSLLMLMPPFLLLRMMLNAIDGMLAREHHMQTPLGAVLNELGDVISDAALYLPFGLLPGVTGFLVVILVVLAIMSEMAGVLGPMVGGQRQYDGPLGKSDRAVTFSIIALLYAAGILPQSGLDVIWLILIGLSIWTTSNRVGSILTEIKKSAVESACS
jgi:CDP-diacylglycerol---glycerol-3-phosphate 3-phosphatidyltransferase